MSSKIYQMVLNASMNDNYLYLLEQNFEASWTDFLTPKFFFMFQYDNEIVEIEGNNGLSKN